MTGRGSHANRCASVRKRRRSPLRRSRRAQPARMNQRTLDDGAERVRRFLEQPWCPASMPGTRVLVIDDDRAALRLSDRSDDLEEMIAVRRGRNICLRPTSGYDLAHRLKADDLVTFGNGLFEARSVECLALCVDEHVAARWMSEACRHRTRANQRDDDFSHVSPLRRTPRHRRDLAPMVSDRIMRYKRRQASVSIRYARFWRAR